MQEVINFNLLKEYDKELRTVSNIWAKEKSYNIDDTVQYKGNYIKCITAGTSGTNTLDFTGLDIGDTLTDGTVTWEIINPPSSGGEGTSIEEWETNTLYKVSDMVLYNNTLYKCNTEHTSSTFSLDSSNWNFIYGEIQEWTANTYYKFGSNVIYENQLYKCTTAHTSSSVWDDIKWQVIGGGSGSSGTGYSQIDLVNISASQENPYISDIEIANNPNHVLPPTDVLKQMIGKYTSENVMKFNSEDKDKFDYNDKGIKFEGGYMMINQSIPTDLEPAVPLGDNYTRTSVPIDLSIYKSVESVVCL